VLLLQQGLPPQQDTGRSFLLLLVGRTTMPVLLVVATGA